MAVRKQSLIGHAIFLLIISFLLGAYSKQNRGIVNIGSWALQAVSYPFQYLYSSFSEGSEDLWQKYLSFRDYSEENQILHYKLVKLQRDQLGLRRLAEENKDLRALLGFKEKNKIKGFAAEVVAYDPSNWTESVTINKGSLDGISAGQAVLSEIGLVGQISSVGLSTAQVLLLSDRRSSIDVLSERSRVRGVVDGDANFKARWQFVFADQDVLTGDQLVSSGLDGIYPQGLLVGTVSSIKKAETGELFQDIQVKFAVDFSKLEKVLVVKK